jgi:hypothetical protein
MNDLLASAVRNNAEWCARICALHGSRSRFTFAAWVSHLPAPLYYPNLVTLRPDCVTAQLALIGAMSRLPAGWGVKDSFGALDLAPLGFRPAAQGRWIRYNEGDADRDGLEWRLIDSHPTLASWEAAWGGDGHRGHARIFRPEILADEAVQIFGGFADGELVAGGIVSAAVGVAGFSNLFAPSPSLRSAAIWQAQRLARGLPLVGWEAAEQDAEGETLGDLQLWLCDDLR